MLPCQIVCLLENGERYRQCYALGQIRSAEYKFWDKQNNFDKAPIIVRKELR